MAAPFQALDFRFDVDCDDPVLHTKVSELLSRFRADTDDTDFAYSFRTSGSRRAPVYELYAGDECLETATDRSPILDYFMWHLNRMVVRATRGRLLLHAGAVEAGGRAVLIPGASEAGKTTLVAALVRAGFRYLTDEIAAIDPSTLVVLPYPKPLTMSPASAELFSDLKARQVHLDPEDIRVGSLGEACLPTLVVVPEYRRRVLPAAVPVSKATAVTILARNSFNFSSAGGAYLEVLARLVYQTRCFRLTIGDLDEASATVRKLFDAPAEEAQL